MKLFKILFFTFIFFYSIFADENRLLNLQYINREHDIKVLTRQLAKDNIDKYLLHSISAGDILINPNNINNKYMFILDDTWNRIVFIKQNNEDWIRAFGEYGNGDGQFYYPQDIEVLNDGHIFVADTYNERIVELLFNFSTEQISFLRNIPTPGWRPRSVCRIKDGVEWIFAATLQNKLLVIANGGVYVYPDDFGYSHWKNSLVNRGAYELDVDETYVYFLDYRYNIINMLTYTSFVTDINLLFQDHFDYTFEGDFDTIRKLAVHSSYPYNAAYLLFDDYNLRIKALSSVEELPLIIPGVENKANAKFDHLKAIGIEEEYGDIFFGERWPPNSSGAPNWKIYWYGLGPEIQDLKKETMDFENENNFTFTSPEEMTVTSQILRPNGSVLHTINSNEPVKSEKVVHFFDEYFNNEYIPYGTYQYKLTAKSAYQKEGDSDQENQTIVTKSFEGGVKPSESDILCSSSYIIQGRSYTVKTYSNSGDFNPEPQYADNWRIVSSDGDAVISDINETQSPYKALYRASHISEGGSLNKVMADWEKLDQVGVKVSFNGLQSSEVTQSYKVYLNNPEVCPILYIGDKPLVNVLPQSDDSERMYTDRITIPPKYLNGAELDINFRENGDDITFFESVELITEDVERGSKIVRTNTGISFEYNKRKNLINTSLSKKHSSEVMQAGDTLDVVVDQSGDVILAMQGSYLGDPIEFCVVYRNDGQFLSVYQKSSSGDRFIDASYARAMSYESNFLLADTLSEGGSREYYVIFHMDYQLDSLFVYEMSENPNKQPDSQQFIIPTPHIFNILAPQVFKENKLEEEGIPDLKPGERIDLKFKLPPLKEDMARFGYLKIVGRYSPYSITNLLDSGLIPKKYAVYQNFPNPFNPSTTIAFSMPAAGSVKITIYNLLGQKIKELRRQYTSGGYYSLLWHGKNNINRPVSSGIYIYRAEILDAAGNSCFNGVKKMLFLK